MSNFPPAQQGQQNGRRPIRWAGLLVGAGLLLLLLWLVWSGIRLANAGRSLLEQQQRVESLMQAGILNANGQELEQIAATVRDDVVEIRQVGGPFVTLGAYFGWLPGVGPLLADAPHLLEMADAGSEMALYGATALQPMLANSQDAQSAMTNSLPRMVAVLEAAQPQLVQADAAAERLLAARALLQHEDKYPKSVSDLLHRFDENAGTLHDGLKLAQAAPNLLGADGSKTYLILAQNEDELRPTGGFISGAGLITVDQGRIVGLTFDNANLVDDWQNKPYDMPPAPFTEFMGMDIFLFRDANFWPNFAESAAQALALYGYGQNVPLDGVVAFDQHFMQQLLTVTGPLPVPSLDRVVDASSVVAQLREEWGPGGDSENWIIERKAFMAPLAVAFRAQLENGLLDASGYDLVQMLQQAAQQRHLQLYSTEPAVEQLLAGTVWGGSLEATPTSDFLHVSDTNMGFNKVNAAVERSLAYQVDLSEPGALESQLEVHYSNPQAATAIECQHGTSYTPDTQYETLTSDCLWNYLRVYVPSGSQLIWASEHPVPAANLMSGVAWPGVARATASENGLFTIFDNFVLLAPGQETTVSFQYSLPNSVLEVQDDQVSYRLHLRKQAGTIANAATVRVTIPDGAEILKVAPEPAVTSGDTMLFDLTLEEDAFIEVIYQE